MPNRPCQDEIATDRRRDDFPSSYPSSQTAHMPDEILVLATAFHDGVEAELMGIAGSLQSVECMEQHVVLRVEGKTRQVLFVKQLTQLCVSTQKVKPALSDPASLGPWQPDVSSPELAQGSVDRACTCRLSQR